MVERVAEDGRSSPDEGRAARSGPSPPREPRPWRSGPGRSPARRGGARRSNAVRVWSSRCSLASSCACPSLRSWSAAPKRLRGRSAPLAMALWHARAPGWRAGRSWRSRYSAASRGRWREWRRGTSVIRPVGRRRRTPPRTRLGSPGSPRCSCRRAPRCRRPGTRPCPGPGVTAPRRWARPPSR